MLSSFPPVTIFPPSSYHIIQLSLLTLTQHHSVVITSMDKEESWTTLLNPSNALDPAIVFLPPSQLSLDTSQQILRMIQNPCLSKPRIMPDCHVGQGSCCIGFTCKIQIDRIIPAYVGGDIGCGICAYPLRTSKCNLKRMEKTIKNLIPMGNGHEHIHDTIPIELTFLDKYFVKAQIEADHFAATHNQPSILYSYEYFSNLCAKISLHMDICMKSFGTLGGGNHFIEINEDEADNNNKYLTIHSGSRSFGMKLFEYYNSLLDPDLHCLVGKHAIDYCYDMILAQVLASMNRHIMCQLILNALDIPYDHEHLMESTHNYIDFHDCILRKGAISAKENEICIVALNMRDGIAICRGKGNIDWNYSCAHGCGRHVSRAESRRRIRLKDYIRSMDGIVSTSVCSGTLDEAPDAYKEYAVVLHALEPTVVVERHLKSVANLKGTT